MATSAVTRRGDAAPPCAPRARGACSAWRRHGAADVVGALAAAAAAAARAAPAAVPAPAAPRRPSPTPPAPIAAQLTVPTPVGYDADRLAAFNRLNEIRLSAGLGMVAQNAAMDQAAQAHAEWMIANDSFTHEESAGTPGFTGGIGRGSGRGVGVCAAEGRRSCRGRVGGRPGRRRAGQLALSPLRHAGLRAGGRRHRMVGAGGDGLLQAAGHRPDASGNRHDAWSRTGGADRASTALRSGRWRARRACRFDWDSKVPNPVPSQDVLSLGTPASVTVAESKTISVTISSSRTQHRCRRARSNPDQSERRELPRSGVVHAARSR